MSVCPGVGAGLGTISGLKAPSISPAAQSHSVTSQLGPQGLGAESVVLASWCVTSVFPKQWSSCVLVSDGESFGQVHVLPLGSLGPVDVLPGVPGADAAALSPLPSCGDTGLASQLHRSTPDRKSGKTCVGHNPRDILGQPSRFELRS